jgi:hypothetical protein
MATPYIVGVGGIALAAGVFLVWKLYRAKRGAKTDLTSRSRAVELQKESMICTGSPVTEDEALRAEFESVKIMPLQPDRDGVLERLVREAIAVGDWWLALEIPKAMTSNLGKDKALKEVVDAAIANKEWCFGALAADQMFYKNFQDQAKQRLTDAAGR